MDARDNPCFEIPLIAGLKKLNRYTRGRLPYSQRAP